MKHVLALIIISLFISFYACTEKNYYGDDSTVVVGAKVLDNPTATISYEEMGKMQKGEILKIRLNREGFNVEQYQIVFEGLYQEDGEKLIVCKTMGDLQVGEGDSGSPILTADGRIAGALCYGIYGNNSQFLARAIEDVMSIDTDKKCGQLAANSTFQKISPYYFITGLANELPEYAKASLPFKYEGIQAGNQKAASLLKDEIPGDPIAGMSIAINIISGDIVNVGAVGTISYMNGDKIFAFGHPFMGQETEGIPAYHASMITLIESNLQPAFKLTDNTTHYIGTMIKDKNEGIMIDKNQTANFINSTTEISLNNGEKAEKYIHNIAKLENLYDQNYYICLSSALSIDAFAPNSGYTMASGQNTVYLSYEGGATNTVSQYIQDSYYYDSDVFYWLQELTYWDERSIVGIKLVVDMTTEN